MQRSALAIAALLTTAAFSSACNDLGTCDDPKQGRQTVLSGNQLMFAGQAILNQSCGGGCHISTAKGAGRQGAPTGLDFDLIPVTNGTVTATGIALPDAALRGLKSRQRDVYENRELIWEQVKKGLMPPTSAFESLAGIVSTMFGSDGKCTGGGQAYTTLSAHKEEFRQWLACDTPIIEATSDMLPYKPLPANATPADMAAGAGYYSIDKVSVGYQYPSCGGGTQPAALDFTTIYNDVLWKPANQCRACHDGAAAMGNFDIGTIDKAWTKLLGTGSGGMTSCTANPVYVKPGDPNGSYLLNMVVGAKMRCTPSTAVMPLGSTTGLPAADVDLITRWIMAGAPRTATAGGVGSDAGVDGGR